MSAAMWNIWIEIAPWMLLGALAAGLMHVLVPTGWLRRHLSGRLGVLKSVTIGIPIPLCSCGVIPVGLGLKKSGASSGATVGFLISTPQTGADSILVSASLLGWPFAILKVGVALVTGLFGGFAANIAVSDSTPTDVSPPTAGHSNTGFWRPLFRHSLEIIESVWGWLLIGVLVSAVITWSVPPDAFREVHLLTGFRALLTTLVISLPLYVCATASVPVAAALVASGLPTGAALVFLMAGPATNVATLGAVYRGLGGRALAVYLISIVGGSLTAGVFFNTLISGDKVAEHLHDHSATGWWHIACGVALAILIARFAISDLLSWWRKRRPMISPTELRTFHVQGMTCQGCASRLEKVLCSVRKLEDAQVSFETGTARVSGKVSDADVFHAVREAGFEMAESQEDNLHSRSM